MADLHDREDNFVFVESCRKCAARYEFKLNSGDIVAVLCGRPNDQKYKAVSYLWEDPVPLPLKCRRCLRLTTIPMRDASKLWRLIDFARGGSIIWLDAMSIDQDDQRDLAEQLAIMGDIYRKAETVSVLLPKSDEEAYTRLKELGLTASAVVKRREDFGVIPDSDSSQILSIRDNSLTELANRYLAQMSDWTSNIHKWKYWRRAWTFQEWAMASELDISCEAAAGSESLTNIKNVIVMASSIIGNWKNIKAAHPAIITESEKLRQRLYMQEEVGRDLNAVRAHFPFEGFLISDEAENQNDLRRRTLMPILPTATDGGTYVTLKSISNASLEFRSLLSLALNAINTSKREATYEADRVACWASMCNIEYDYDKYDSFAVALHKAITALRRRGITIYNFLVNTDSGETDLKFLDYAAAHRQSNTASAGYLFGTPIFIGRADTLTHIRHSLSQDGDVVHLDGTSNVTLRLVDKVTIKESVSWGERTKAIPTFRSIISGKADGIRLFDIADMVERAINDIESAQLNKYLLVTVSIAMHKASDLEYFNAWGICPSDILLSDLFVARESLNGTLVLAVYRGPKPAKEAQIVSYLNTTHQRDETYLVKADESGVVDIIFRTADATKHELLQMLGLEMSTIPGQPSIPEWDLIDMLNDRALDAKVSLANRELPLVRTSNERQI